MEKNLIAVKENITINGQIVVNKGVYDRQRFIDKYPVFDYKNKSLFQSIDINLFEPGTKVIYKGHAYYIIDSGVRYHKRSYWLDHSTSLTSNMKILNGSVILKPTDLSYEIASSMTSREKDHIIVTGSELTICEKYWFINSEGAVCEAYLGEKPNGDNWRKKTGNYYPTKDDARIAVANIVNGFKQ